MSIWNKVLIGVIIVASMGLFYMTMRTLHTHQHWRENAQQHEKRIKELKAQCRQVIEGQGEGKGRQKGIQDLRLELQKKLANRGRVWRQCNPIPGQQPQTTAGQVDVTTDVHGIEPKTLLYVFDDGSAVDGDARQGGRYLGEFKVVSVDQAKNLARLAPSMTMTNQELSDLAQSAAGNRTWTLYEIMPADSHEAFAHLTQEELKELLPAERVEEYLNDGQLLTTDDVEGMGLQGRVVAVEVFQDEIRRVVYEDQDGRILYASKVVMVEEDGKEVKRLIYEDEKEEFAYAATRYEEVDANGEVVYRMRYFDESGQELPAVTVVEKEITSGKGKYLRRLQDYAVELKDHRLQRSNLVAKNEKALSDLAYAKSTLAKAEEDEKFFEREKARLTTEEQKADYQLAVVNELLQNLRRELKQRRAEIDSYIAENMRMAAEIDKRQQEAKQRIDTRTGRMAQSGAGDTR